MPREAKGELRKLADGWEARVTIQGRERLGLELPFSHTQEKEADDRCKLLAGLARRLRKAGAVADAPALLKMAAVAPAGPKLDGVIKAIDAMCTVGRTERETGTEIPTFKQFGQEWTSGGLHKKWPDYVKKKRTSDGDAGRLAKHVYPIVQHVPLDAFRLDHANAVMASLPSDLSKASRRHYAQLMHRILAMAVWPSQIIEANPLPRGFLPKLGRPKMYPVLYPEDDSQLLACVDVPIQWRIFWGWLHREGGRMGEAMSLQWKELNLELGTVQIDENKTDAGRAPWVLNKGVALALQAYRERYCPNAEPDDHVFTDEYGRFIIDEHMADRVRKHLETAGLKKTRPDLFDAGVNRGRFGTHGFRRSFVTIHLAAGYSETWCTDRTGHETRSQLDRYRQTARTIKELNLGELTPLDQAIPELYDEPSSNSPGIPQEPQRPLGEMANAEDLKSSVSQETSRFESGRGHSAQFAWSIAGERGVQCSRALGNGTQTADLGRFG
jgi:integrase